MSKSPTPDEIRAARDAVGATQAEAAAKVYCHTYTWVKWERGERRMPRATYELFLIKTGQKKA